MTLLRKIGANLRNAWRKLLASLGLVRDGSVDRTK